MTEENKSAKQRNQYPDRFSVDPENLVKIGQLLGQIVSSVRGCRVTRKEMLNWIVEKFPKNLSSQDLQELSARFYDEERFLKQALEELRSARARGETLALNTILQNQPTGIKPQKERKKRGTKVATSIATEVESKEPSILS